MAVVTLMISAAVLATLAAWLAMDRLQREYARYRAVFRYETSHGMAEFFLYVDPGQLWGVNLAFAGAVAALILGVFESLIGAVVGAAAALAMPRWLLGWGRRRRLRRIDAQLPDFLLALAGALRAGSGLQAGLRQVVHHAEGPLAQEFGLVLQQQRMGITFADALESLLYRVSTESMGLFVAAIKVAGHTGGSLAETLERISLTLRTRLQLLGRIRALTSQGRMQAWIMAGLPVLLALALHGLDPESMALLWQSPAGWGVLVLIGGLEALGIFLVRRIVNIDV